MSVTVLVIIVIAFGFVADGVIFLLLWEWARIERERESNELNQERKL